MPAAWMISSNGTEDTISFFLQLVQTQNPGLFPEIFMSDKDHAQMNAIKSCYPKSTLLLCWWHVLHAWQQHFVVSSFPALWDILKKWIQITDPVEFWEYWSEIKFLAPKSMIEYLQSYWLESSMIPTLVSSLSE